MLCRPGGRYTKEGILKTSFMQIVDLNREIADKSIYERKMLILSDITKEISEFFRKSNREHNNIT